ncbi:uncharacterized protein ALTATR162_LOCUS1427 [Alternaria atra]|uniref:Uncharacterized protein n=1 Tax=Alternaria atra TaxID=119953 RepID=A0A8J2HT91_9PLEO|nr:uncharacterized protein ALTATR162_LOCUS1427 [Alternaria atra]CAG5143831.1 unnamed protein product [Alternaria atra]
MKNAVILAALASTTVAAPFSDYLDAIFGTKESRQAPPPELMPGFAPIGTGTASGFPFPTATGAFPAPTDGMQPVRHRVRNLAIDYQLAPRQEAGAGSSLPSFSLAEPTDGTPALPTETEGGFPGLPTGQPDAPFPLPTGGPDMPYPTGGFPKPPGDGPSPSDIPFPTDLPFPMPTGGSPFPFPGTGMPGLPTTMQTLTRGPQPTGMPELPGSENGEEGPGDDAPGGFFDWLSSLFGGGKE